MADKYGTKEKQEYLDYYESMRRKGQKPVKWGTWKQRKKLKRGSTQRTRQVSSSLKAAGLSDEEIMRMR
jgi:hypothetical protein